MEAPRYNAQLVVGLLAAVGLATVLSEIAKGLERAWLYSTLERADLSERIEEAVDRILNEERDGD